MTNRLNKSVHSALVNVGTRDSSRMDEKRVDDIDSIEDDEQ